MRAGKSFYLFEIRLCCAKYLSEFFLRIIFSPRTEMILKQARGITFWAVSSPGNDDSDHDHLLLKKIFRKIHCKCTVALQINFSFIFTSCLTNNCLDKPNIVYHKSKRHNEVSTLPFP